MAHKKGQGSSRNGRDSNAQRRGVKSLAANKSGPAIFWFGNVEINGILAKVLARGKTIHCLL